MNLSSDSMKDVLVVTVNETRIDASVAIKFKDQMRIMTQNDAPHVILDLSKVDFIDSSGLGAIVAAKKQLGSSRQIDLSGLTANVDKVFRLTRMDTIFKIHDSIGEATAPA